MNSNYQRNHFFYQNTVIKEFIYFTKIRLELKCFACCALNGRGGGIFLPQIGKIVKPISHKFCYIDSQKFGQVIILWIGFCLGLRCFKIISFFFYPQFSILGKNIPPSSVCFILIFLFLKST